MTLDNTASDAAIAAALAEHDNPFAHSLRTWHARGREFTFAQRTAALDMLRGAPKPTHRLSNAQRSALKRAISAHPNWPDLRKSERLSLADMSTAHTIRAAQRLGIDIDAATKGAKARGAGSGSDTFSNWAERAKARMGDAADTGGTSDATAAAAADSETVAELRAAVASLAADLKQARNDTERAMSELAARMALSQTLRIEQADREPIELEGIQHPLFRELLLACSIRHVDGNRGNVWVAGPAGSGKTTAARNVATALGLEFGTHGAMTMEHQLVGYVSQVTGQYVETPFTRLFQNGGVCLLDEIDAGSNEALLALNSALANGFMTLPSGEFVTRHPDFVCIGAGNTWGEGPNATYVGRAKLDAAFLDRFHPRLPWGYDTDLERALAGNDDWVTAVQRARSYAAANGLKVVISPRASIQGAALIAGGFSFDRVVELELCASLTDDQAQSLKRHLRTL